MTKAYSYVRFSTPEQARGDSFRRQTELATQYAARHKLQLDESLTLRDLGVSAFRGANVETGALGAFLKAIDSGDVEPGSVLLVEALDRISRRTARKAIRVLEEIVEAGVDVVTLADGKRYTQENLDGFDFLMAFLLLIRGNEESATKSRRLKATWGAKRRAAGEKLLTRRVPGWIAINGNGKLELDRERAKIVKRIFKMFLAGHGKHAIAATLNLAGEETFGEGGRRASHWHKSYVYKILTNPAVIGTLVPHAVEYDAHGKKARVAQEPVLGYYPAVVDDETFNRAQALLQAGSPARGLHADRKVQNILAGLARCPHCGSTMTRIMKGSGDKAGPPFLVCTKWKAGKGCAYHPVKLDGVERAILNNARELPATCPHPDASTQDELESVDNALADTNEKIQNVVDAISVRPSTALADKLEKLEADVAELRAVRAEIAPRAERTDSKLVRRRAERLQEALSSPRLDRQQVNAAMRECFEKVVVDYSRGTLGFTWRQGGETELPFDWPNESKAA